jgi:hypothetical protein
MSKHSRPVHRGPNKHTSGYFFYSTTSQFGDSKIESVQHECQHVLMKKKRAEILKQRGKPNELEHANYE